MIDWNKYFDHVYIISRAKNIERRQKLEIEFNRIGLTNYHWWYNCDNELINYSKITDIYGIGPQRCTFGHYNLIKTAYELEYENILIMEDDIQFLKDINEIENQLNIFLNNKNKCDAYYFDYVRDSSNIILNSCYYINRKMMNYFIYCMEHFHLLCDCYVPAELLYPNDYISLTYTYFYTDDIYTEYIDTSERAQVLPIQVMLSPKRICVQSEKKFAYSNMTIVNKLENLNDYNI